MLFWYLRISRRATVPGRYRCGFFTPPLAGADLRAALVASCFRGALPPVDLRAVCLVRAIVCVRVVAYKVALGMIKAAGRPLTLAFQKPMVSVAKAAPAPQPASPQVYKKKPVRVAREATKLRGKSVLEDTEREKVMAALAAEAADENRLETFGEEGEEESEEDDELPTQAPAPPPRAEPPAASRSSAKDTSWLAVGKRYSCVKRSVFRAGFDMDSDKAGIVERGDVLTITEVRVNEADTARIRFDRGWMSATTVDGESTVALLASYRSLRRAMVRVGYEMDSSKVRVLEPGMTIEVTDRRVNEAGIGRLKFNEGWTSESMTTGEATFEKMG